MAELVPARSMRTASPVAAARLTVDRWRAENAVATHAVAAWVQSQNDQSDTYALADAISCATEEELRLLEDGLRRANGHAVKRELVLRKVALMSQLDDHRISRRFG